MTQNSNFKKKKKTNKNTHISKGQFGSQETIIVLLKAWVRGSSAEGQVPHTASLCPSILPQAARHTGSSADHEGSPTWSLLCPRNSQPHLAWQLAKTEGQPIWGRQRNPKLSLKGNLCNQRLGRVGEQRPFYQGNIHSFHSRGDPKGESPKPAKRNWSGGRWMGLSPYPDVGLLVSAQAHTEEDMTVSWNKGLDREEPWKISWFDFCVMIPTHLVWNS